MNEWLPMCFWKLRWQEQELKVKTMNHNLIPFELVVKDSLDLAQSFIVKLKPIVILYSLSLTLSDYSQHKSKDSTTTVHSQKNKLLVKNVFLKANARSPQCPHIQWKETFLLTVPPRIHFVP